MELWEIRVEIPAAAAEGTELALLEHGVGEWSLLEDAIATRAWVVGIFHAETEAEAAWAALRPSLPVEPAGEFRPRPLPDTDWANSYRVHFKPWTFGRLHWVPVWERGSFRTPAGHSVLWLDPGLAFGTGNHETTRLCIERLLEFEARMAGGHGSPATMRVLDAGCGSGILALSAALLGFGDVEGFAPIHPQDARRFSGFDRTFVSGAARPPLSLGQVQNGGRDAKGAHAEQSAAAGLLHVVAMGGDGKNVSRGCRGDRLFRHARFLR